MGRREIPSQPIARAPAVQERLEAANSVLASLKLGIAELQLGDVEGKPAAKENLAALHEKIRAAAVERDGLAEAYDLALRLDRDAITARKAAIFALPPERLIEGITKTACCTLCGPDGCVLSAGAQCVHPFKAGVPSGLQSNPTVQKMRRLVHQKLNIKGAGVS